MEFMTLSVPFAERQKILMKKILDIEFAPLATYQSLIGDLFSVISLHSNFKEWLCSNINQLVYFRDFEEREFYGMGFFYEHQPREEGVAKSSN